MTKTATKITGTRTAKPADKRGPKAGSARANQSVKLSAADKAQINAEAASRTPAKPKKSDVIDSVKNVTSGGSYTAVTAPGHEALLIKQNHFTGELQKLAVVGGSFKAVVALHASILAHQPAAKLANGLDARNAPQSAMAAAKRGKPEAPAAKPAKATPAPKAAKPAKEAKAPATGGVDRKYKATKKEDNSKPESFRRYMISTIRAHGTTSAAKAAHAASGKFGHERLNFKWAHDNGYIVLADLA